MARLAGNHIDHLDSLVAQHGVAAILLVRLIPAIPFTVINAAAALSAVRFGTYLLGTAIGIIPGVFAYVALGAYGAKPGSWKFAAAVVAFLVLTGVGVVAARRHRQHPPRGHSPITSADSAD